MFQWMRMLANSDATRKPRLVYVIPAFHNPTGQVMGRARRERLVALSREHGFVIVADEVYQFLHHGEPPPPSFGGAEEWPPVAGAMTFIVA